MLYSYLNNEPKPLPYRIRLSNGQTRTDPSTFTEEEIIDAGYIPITQEKPVPEKNQIVYWSKQDVAWCVRDKSVEQIQSEIDNEWSKIRSIRDEILFNLDWKFIRHESQVRLGITPTDNLSSLDTYAQALRDITLQEDPFNITWPTLETPVLEEENLNEEISDV
jgi:hypothetical protein